MRALFNTMSMHYIPRKKVCVAQKSLICFAPRGLVGFAIVAKPKTKEITFLEITAFEFSLQES